MNIIFGNFGDPTIALIQWACEHALADVYVVSIDTGWQAQDWQARVDAAQAYVQQCGFTVVRLKAKADFAALMRERRAFPTPKFQWCAGFLKGLALIDWLDHIDPSCEATVVLGKRRATSRANQTLAEYIPESEHYGERQVWHPLLELTDAAFDGLIKRAGFAILRQRSRECDPCVNNTQADFCTLAPVDVLKTQALEQELKRTMFTSPIETMVARSKKSETKTTNASEQFDRGCGSPYACGE